MTIPPNTAPLHARLQHDGFAFLTSDVMRDLLDAPSLADWPAFAASWDDLAADAYLAASGRHRQRRHATFCAVGTDAISREPHQAHFQSLRYNALQGDIQRWFEPVREDVGQGVCLQRILGFCRNFFSGLAPQVARWHIEVHQFRIEARAGEAGEPTPEGMHRDGVDYVLVLLIDRINIASGTTTIHALDHHTLGSFTLTHPFDAALVNDKRVFHGVTAVTALDDTQRSHRDVLVVTFRGVAPTTTQPELQAR